MNPGGRDIITDVMVYGEDGSVYDAEPNTYAEGRAEARAEARAEGAKEATISNARAMLAGGIPSDCVADILKLSESDMKEVMNMR